MKKTELVDFKSDFFNREVMFLYDYYSLEIVDANENALTKYGYPKAELLGKKISALGEKFKTKDRLGKSDHHTGNIWKHYSKAGDVFFVQFTLQQLKYNGRIVQLAVAHDLSDKID